MINYTSTFTLNRQKYHYIDLVKASKDYDIELDSLPYTIKILLESLLRKHDDICITKNNIETLFHYNSKAPQGEVPFKPSRVILQDFTGVPVVVDLASMRDAVVENGGSPDLINPEIPVDLVIDHSVQVDFFGNQDAFDANIDLEFERNNERYEFLKWAEKTFENYRAVPPATGIIHQVNLEFLSDVIINKDPYSGSIVTSGPTSIKDSSWLLGYSISRQPHFKEQKKNELVIWLYALYTDRKGDYVAKRPDECTGIEMCEEWLYHIGVPENTIHELACSASTIPCHMPYITTYFMPRTTNDRPLVVPKHSKNLAFIGNYAETPRDTVFTTEYSVRTAMEAVYTLLEVDRGVPEVFASTFDIRMLLNALYYLNGQKSLIEIDFPWVEKAALKEALKKVKGTYIEELLKDYHLI